MIGPVIGQADDGAGLVRLVSAEQRHGLGQLAVVDFRQGGGAVIERGLQISDELIFALGGLAFLFFVWRRIGSVRQLSAEKAVGFGDVAHEVAERHLLLGGFVVVLIGWHFFGGPDNVLRRPLQLMLHGVGDRILVILRKDRDR